MKLSYYIIPALVLFLASCNWGWKNNPPPSGYYGQNLLLAYDPVGAIITGMYVKNIADSIPDPECSLYFTAKFYGKKNNTIAWLPSQRDKDNRYGTLEMVDETSFKFYWQRNLNGCPQSPDFESNKVIMKLRKPEDWQFIRTVRTENAIVHASPSKEAAAVGYVQRDVIVKVLQRNQKWLEVIAGRNDSLRGWVFHKNLKRFPS